MSPGVVYVDRVMVSVEACFGMVVVYCLVPFKHIPSIIVVHGNSKSIGGCAGTLFMATHFPEAMFDPECPQYNSFLGMMPSQNMVQLSCVVFHMHVLFVQSCSQALSKINEPVLFSISVIMLSLGHLITNV